jgi:hypothetical protein
MRCTTCLRWRRLRERVQGRNEEDGCGEKQRQKKLQFPAKGRQGQV